MPQSSEELTAAITSVWTSDTEAMDRIQGLLSCLEWDTETIEQVADIIRETGREVKDPEEMGSLYHRSLPRAGVDGGFHANTSLNGHSP